MQSNTQLHKKKPHREQISILTDVLEKKQADLQGAMALKEQVEKTMEELKIEIDGLEARIHQVQEEQLAKVNAKKAPTLLGGHIAQLFEAATTLSSEEANVFNVLLQKVSASIIAQQKEAGDVAMTPQHGTESVDGESSSQRAQRSLDA
eukprot:4793429-Karenia_brevis.AAC.1